MVRGIGTGVVGAGVTLVSTFAGSLGLSLHQQRIGFALGALLMLGGIGLLVSDHVRRKRGDTEQVRDEPVFTAVEGEIALAREEALEMAKLLRVEWPYISVDGALVETALPDWRAKTTEFIGTVLGAAQRAAFKASETGSDVLERLESEGRFLEGLSTSISANSIRTDEVSFLAARRKRREHDAARFLVYDHHRASGAPPLAGQSDQQNAPVPLADEFARMIDEGRNLAGDEYSGSPSWGEFDFWRAGLGPAEKQRLLEVKPERGDKPRDHVLAVVAWLCERRDQSDSLTLLLADEELTAAIEARWGTQPPDSALCNNVLQAC